MDKGLFALRQGDGARTVVFLHGFGATHRIWGAVQEEMRGHAETLAFDMPGHGGSIHHEGRAAPRAAAEAILAELGRQGAASVDLVGHSMGGAVAVLAALAAPGRVRSLTLLAPGGFGREMNHRLLSRYAAARQRPELLDSLGEMFGWNNPVPEPVVEDHIHMRARPGQTEALADILAGMIRDGGQGEIGRARMAGLAMPVKVLWGTQDRVLPTRQSHRLPGIFAAHIFEDTGHMLQCERPRDVARLILQNIR